MISQANPANNGEPLFKSERAIPWEVESCQLFDPVTTEVERPRWSSLSQDKSKDSIRRRPFSPFFGQKATFSVVICPMKDER